jgi:lysylphosphatidylglycerol synthetase-like protein (DUF2156 family)
VQQHRSRGLTIISIAIFVGGIVFIALGIGIFSIVPNYSEADVQDYLNNQTSGVRSIIAKTVTDALAPHIETFTYISKGIMTSIAAFLCLVGVGICFLGFGLFKVKYLAWIVTVVLMFLAIVIDVLGLGFVGGSLPSSPDEKGIMLADFAYLLIGIMIAHLIANAFIIYYLTRKSTTSIFRT